MILGSVPTKPKKRVLDQSQMQKNDTLGQLQEPTKKWFWDRHVMYHDVLIPTLHSVLEKLSSSLKQMNYVREAIKKILKHMQFSRSWITTLCRQITTLSYVLHSNIPRWWPSFFGSRWKNLIWKCHLYFSFGSSGCFNIHQKALTILGSYSCIFFKAFLSYMTMLRVFFGIRNIKSKNDNKF